MADMTGQELREITARLGWTAAELARRMGCARQRVAALEQGDAPIPPDLALALRGAAAWLDAYPVPGGRTNAGDRDPNGSASARDPAPHSRRGLKKNQP